MVEEVKELSPELQIHGLAEGQREVLEDREIRVDKIRPINRRAGSCSEFSQRGLRKSAGVEPILVSVDLGRAVRIATFRPCLVRIAHFVRTLQGEAVIGEVRARLIGAIDHKQREAGGDSFDQIHLPMPEEGVGGGTPATAKPFALAEWQVIKDAGGKVVIEVQLRQPPIQFVES